MSGRASESNTAVDPRFSSQRAVHIAVVVGLSVVLYARTLSHPLVYDSINLVQDPVIHDLSNIPSFFYTSSTPSGDLEGQQTRALQYWRPVAKSIIAVVYWLSGERSIGYHALNVALNAVAVALYYLLVLGIVGAPRIAMLAAVLFAVNPSHTEAVYWAYSYTSLLEAVFGLAAILSYRRDHLPRSLVFTLLACMSRESGVLVLPVLVVHDLWIARRPPPVIARRLWPLAAMSVGFLVVRSLIVGAPSPMGVPAKGAVWWMQAVGFNLLKSFKLMLWPDAQVAHYLVRSFTSLEVASAAVATLAYVAVLVILAKRRPEWAFWWAWIAIWVSLTFLPGHAGHYLYAEKVLYLASGGGCVLVAAALGSRGRRPWLLAPLVVAHLLVTWWRGDAWRDRLEHMRAIVAFEPKHAGAWYVLGSQLAKSNRCAEAIPAFQRVLSLEPAHSHSLNNAGSCYWVLGQSDQAEQMWSRAARADPFNPQSAYNLGLAAEARRDDAAAILHFRRFLSLSPQYLADARERIDRLTQRISTTPGHVAAPAGAQ